LILVPARKGSKRLPEKNRVRLGSVFLADWTIDFAKKIKKDAQDGKVEILLSTDDPVLLQRYDDGEILCNHRPADLCTDTATTADVVAHEMRRLEAEQAMFDTVCVLQLTNPFRSIADWRAAYKKFLINPEVPLVYVRTPADHPYWCFRIEGNFGSPMFGLDRLIRRSQDLPSCFVISGLFYFVSRDFVVSKRMLVGEVTNYFLCDRLESAIDIDTVDDLREAQKALKGLASDIFAPY
jgi:CMP-N,N'-diacetyllegionaminic acid synthase